ncbi:MULTISPECIES: hypothetical protein [unclassified Kitasatospora]|uniref:DUF7507 domain-containing protein n=1 Tax=unclassified Kitasatospora TaxID=2633591 RepID=UPI00380C6C67
MTDLTPGVTVSGCGTNQLAPGQSTTCQATYVTTAADVAAQNVPDQGQVTGTTPSGQNITSTSNKVTVPFAGLKIVKAVQETSFSAAGQALHYTFTVTNTGDTTISSLAVTDSGPGTPAVSCPVTTLAPGASTTCTATYSTAESDVQAGKITDTSTVTGTTPDGTPVTATSNTVTIVACTPCEDQDHGGCDGHNPGGHGGWGDHPNGGIALAHAGTQVRTAGIAGGWLLAVGALLTWFVQTRKRRSNGTR